MYNYKYVKFSEFQNDIVLTFSFSFDGWISDQCIVYDIKKPQHWACSSSYNKKDAQVIQELINKLISKRGEYAKKCLQ